MSKSIKTNAPTHPFTEIHPLKWFSQWSVLNWMQEEFLIVQVFSISPDILNDINLLFSASIPITCAALIYTGSRGSETDALCGDIYKQKNGYEFLNSKCNAGLIKRELSERH